MTPSVKRRWIPTCPLSRRVGPITRGNLCTIHDLTETPLFSTTPPKGPGTRSSVRTTEERPRAGFKREVAVGAVEISGGICLCSTVIGDLRVGYKRKMRYGCRDSISRCRTTRSVVRTFCVLVHEEACCFTSFRARVMVGPCKGQFPTALYTASWIPCSPNLPRRRHVQVEMDVVSGPADGDKIRIPVALG